MLLVTTNMLLENFEFNPPWRVLVSMLFTSEWVESWNLTELELDFLWTVCPQFYLYFTNVSRIFSSSCIGSVFRRFKIPLALTIFIPFCILPTNRAVFFCTPISKMNCFVKMSGWIMLLLFPFSALPDLFYRIVRNYIGHFSKLSKTLTSNSTLRTGSGHSYDDVNAFHNLT